MSSDDLTKTISTEDKIDSLLVLVRQVASDVKTLNSRVDALEQKVDARLHDTRPIWEAVQSRLETIETEIRDGFRRVNQKIELLHKDILELQTDNKLLEGRVDDLERKAS